MFYLKISILLVFCITACSGMNYQFSRKLYEAVLSNYTKHVKPRLLSADAVTVNIDFHINAIIDFNEKSGVLTFLGKFDLEWWDEIIMWSPAAHGNLDMIQLSMHDVWIPKIAIGNTVDYHSLYKFDNYFDSMMTYITYYHNGSARTSSSGVWQTICNCDITKFPFDVHECTIQLDSQHTSVDVKLMPMRNSPNVIYTTMHSEFAIRNSSVKSGPLNDDVTWSQITYIIKLGRKPLFMMMNLVVPVYILSVANLLVFLLPLDSSDRMAYSVTMLLTFTVFMTMVTEKLPATDPLSNFNTFLLLQLVFSTVITLCVLLIHYVYNRDQAKPVPKWTLCLITPRYTDENKVEPLKKDFAVDDESQWKTIAIFLNKGILVVLTLIILLELIVFYCATGTDL